MPADVRQRLQSVFAGMLNCCESIVQLCKAIMPPRFSFADGHVHFLLQLT